MTGSIPTLTVRIPRHDECIRVHPDQHKEVHVIRDDDGTYYLIAPEMVSTVMEARPDRVEHSVLFLVCNLEMENFVWPVKMPVPEDHVAYRAMHEWIHFRSLH